MSQLFDVPNIVWFLNGNENGQCHRKHAWQEKVQHRWKTNTHKRKLNFMNDLSFSFLFLNFFWLVLVISNVFLLLFISFLYFFIPDKEKHDFHHDEKKKKQKKKNSQGGCLS